MVQQVLFFFSGHSNEREQGICVGLQSQQQLIRAQDLTRALADIGGPTTTRIVVLDCCFAGAIVSQLNAPNMAGKEPREV